MKSMTGFGRASHATNTIVANIEISSVNRKQAEVVVQLPRNYAELEAGIRKYVLQHIARGRVNLSINVEQADSAPSPISVDSAKAKALSEALKDLSHEIGHPLDITAADILRVPDIIQFEDKNVDPQSVQEAIEPALTDAVEKLIEMRAREGTDLKQDTLMRLQHLLNTTEQIESHAPSVITRYRENLHRRLEESGLELDLSDERLLKEIGVFADRCDISEEITRLRSHFDKFHEFLETPEPVGRSLDFLCQEINREFNTIGSKANDATLAQLVVSSKTELEKIREQIQNVE